MLTKEEERGVYDALVDARNDGHVIDTEVLCLVAAEATKELRGAALQFGPQLGTILQVSASPCTGHLPICRLFLQKAAQAHAPPPGLHGPTSSDGRASNSNPVVAAGVRGDCSGPQVLWN